VKKSEDASTEGVRRTNEMAQEGVSPDLKAVCVAPHELRSGQRILYAVVAPFNKRTEVKTEWGSSGEILFLKKMVEIFFCVPLKEGGDHLQLPDNNIR
jgi:hypothetical protein